MIYQTHAERQAAVAAAIQKLADKNRDGVCHPSALVAAARDPRHVCHDMFEWDDTAAAEAYRVDQSRRIIRSVRVDMDGPGTRAPAFVHVRINRGEDEPPADGYMPTVKALAVPNLKEQVLADAKAQLRGLQVRYAAIKELQPVWSALDSLDDEA